MHGCVLGKSYTILFREAFVIISPHWTAQASSNRGLNNILEYGNTMNYSIAMEMNS